MRKTRRRQVTTEQIANVLTLGVEFSNADVIGWLSEKNIVMGDIALGGRMRIFAGLGFVERVRFGKCVFWKVSAAQYRLLIEYGEQKIENKQAATERRFPTEFRKPKPIPKVKDTDGVQWGSKSLTGRSGETVKMECVW